MVEVKEKVPLAPYTIYKIGGPARFLIEAKSSEDLKEALDFAATQGVPFFILGTGSNVLISDKGFDGLVIRMTGGEVKADGERLITDAGVMVARAVGESAKAGLTGFEWGIGIPGTIGGSVRGNAGCFGGEITQVLERVQVLEITNNKSQSTKKSQSINHKFQTKELTNEECEFSYRDSVFKRHPEWVVLSATLKLRKGEQAAILEKIKQITAERLAKQDIGAKSCGCIFKNIPWLRKDVNKEELLRSFPETAQFADRDTIPASFLIDSVGLKDRRVGKVVISAKHANYFVNEGGATAAEVAALAAIAKDAVRRKYGLQLEEEIQYVGHD